MSLLYQHSNCWFMDCTFMQYHVDIPYKYIHLSTYKEHVLLSILHEDAGTYHHPPPASKNLYIGTMHRYSTLAWLDLHTVLWHSIFWVVITILFIYDIADTIYIHDWYGQECQPREHLTDHMLVFYIISLVSFPYQRLFIWPICNVTMFLNYK